MNVAVIIPVGPGHEALAERAVRSVHLAWTRTRGPFRHLSVCPVADPRGRLGRSRARNQGMDGSPDADWHFLLDADDTMASDAFRLVVLDEPATFGAIDLEGRRKFLRTENVWPCTRETLFTHGAKGTLAMGCFLRGDLGVRFDETMDVAEDYDFYLRLPGFFKRREPLVRIGYGRPSATGPRGYVKIDWLGECQKVIERYRAGPLRTAGPVAGTTWAALARGHRNIAPGSALP